MRGKVLEAYRCFDAGRSNLCVIYRNPVEVKNTWRTLYAKLYIISLVLFIACAMLTLGLIFIFIPPIVHILYLILSYGPLVRQKLWSRLLSAVFAWGSFAPIMFIGNTAIVSYILYPIGLSHITDDKVFASALSTTNLAVTIAFALLMIILASLLKPVTLVEVEKDPRRHRLTWWVMKRYYILKLFWNL